RAALAVVAAHASRIARRDDRACEELVRDHAEDDADDLHRWPPARCGNDHAHGLGRDDRRVRRAVRARLGLFAMRRSNAPVFWLLFGAGGMLCALLGPVLVFITGLAVPLGWPLTAGGMGHPPTVAPLPRL